MRGELSHIADDVNAAVIGLLPPSVICSHRRPRLLMVRRIALDVADEFDGSQELLDASAPFQVWRDKCQMPIPTHDQSSNWARSIASTVSFRR